MFKELFSRINYLKDKLIFDKNFYLEKYPDVKKAGIDPFFHYEKYGKKEGRLPNKHSHKKNINFQSQQKFIDLERINETNCIDGSIAVHLHLYYLDLSDEMISYLKNIPFHFDLFISVTSEEYAESTKNKFVDSLENIDNCFVSQVQNVGRDIYPFAVFFAKEISKYTYFCHIQTKKSLSSTSFTKLYFWRKYLLDSILGTPSTVKKIFTLLKNSKSGMVFPEPFFNLAYNNIQISWWNRYSSNNYLVKKIGVFLPDNDVLFPAGTMFWCRTSCLNKLFNANLSVSDFPKESGILNDGSTAHALERLLGIIPLCSGFKNFVIRSPQNKLFGTSNLYEAQRKIMMKTFSLDWYKSAYPDVVSAKIDLLYHYQNFGFKEGRIHVDYYPDNIINKIIKQYSNTKNKSADPDFDIRYYLKSHHDVVNACLFGGVSPYDHFSCIGSKVGFVSSDAPRQKVIKSKSIDNVSFAIIIPVFNSAKYLENCLKSAYMQNVKHLHIIIVNDGSTDNSQDIIEKFRLKYPQITTVINHEVNKGLVATHSDAIKCINEDYFTVLDGDDWLDLNFCSELYYISQAYDAECVCCNWTRPKEYSEPRNTPQLPIDLRVVEGDTLINSIANWKSYPNIHYGLNRKLYLTSSWKRINPSYPADTRVIYSEDCVLTNNYFMGCKRVACIRNFYYNWFDNSESVSNLDLPVKYVLDNFQALNDIYYLSKNDNKFVQELFTRNVNNTIMTEFQSRLNKLFTKSKEKTKFLIESFAEKFDKNLHLFTEKQKYDLETFLMTMYFQIVSVGQKIEDYVLLLDPVGINNIEIYFKDYFIEKSHCLVKYIGLKNSDSLSDRLSNMVIGCKAKVVVTTGGWAINQFHSNRPIIQLWHGLGAIKKVAPFGKAIKPVLGFCSSKDVIKVYSELYNIPTNLVKPYGSIVTDCILDENNKNTSQNRVYELYPNIKDKKVYLWCPTFRGKANNLYINDVIDFEELSKELKDDEIFLYKFHPAVKIEDSKNGNSSQFKNIIDVTSYDNLIDLLSVTHTFITDYSSSLHYAMIMGIKVSFLITDYEEYKSSQGLLINLSDFPGPVCDTTNVHKFLKSIRAATHYDRNAYDKFVNFHCGACREQTSRSRIFDEIMKYINNMKV